MDDKDWARLMMLYSSWVARNLSRKRAVWTEWHALPGEPQTPLKDQVAVDSLIASLREEWGRKGG